MAERGVKKMEDRPTEYARSDIVWWASLFGGESQSRFVPRASSFFVFFLLSSEKEKRERIAASVPLWSMRSNKEFFFIPGIEIEREKGREED